MMLVLATFLFALYVASPGPTAVSPETLHELTYDYDRAPHCKPMTDAERWSDGTYPQGKAATFNLVGSYVCEREIFDYGDRDSFAQLVARHTGTRIKSAAVKIGNDHRDKATWTVQIEADDPAISRYVTSAVRAELASALGAGRVGRAPAPQEAVDAVVSVRVNRVTNPEQLLDIFVIFADQEGKRRWRAY